MSSSSEMIQGLEQASQKHEKEIVIELGSDRILHYVGVYLVIVLAVITKISDLTGKNLSCFPANKSSGYNTAFINYASTYCWETSVENSANLSECNRFNETNVNLLQNPNLIKGFVQWMPYAMLLEAFLFALPSAWWHFRVGARLMGHLKFMQLLLNDIYESVKTIPAGIYRKKPYDKDGVYLNGWLPFKEDYKTIDQQGLGVEEKFENQANTTKETQGAGTHQRPNIFKRLFGRLWENKSGQSTTTTGYVSVTAKASTDSSKISVPLTPRGSPQQRQKGNGESKDVGSQPVSKQSSLASSRHPIVVDVHKSGNESEETPSDTVRIKHKSEPEFRKRQDVGSRTDSKNFSVAGSHHSPPKDPVESRNESEQISDDGDAKEFEDESSVAEEYDEILPNRPLIAPPREKRRMKAITLRASQTREVHSEEATSESDSETGKIFFRSKSADQISMKLPTRKLQKERGRRQKKVSARAFNTNNRPKEPRKTAHPASGTEAEEENLSKKPERKNVPEQTKKMVKESSGTDNLKNDVTPNTDDDQPEQKKSVKKQSDDEAKIYLTKNPKKVEVLNVVADDQFSEENTDDEERMKKKEPQDMKQTKPPSAWEVFLVGRMLDQHLFSMLCYENFASLEYHPYIMSVYQLTSTMAAVGDKRGIYPLKQGILRQFCHKDNFKSRFLVRSYMIRSIVSILLAIIVFIAITVLFQMGICEILKTKLFSCEIAFTDDTPLLCTLERTSDILAMYFANWAIIFVYMVLSCWQLFFVRYGTSRALSHYFEDMQDSCSVALLAAHKAAKAAKEAK